VDLKGSPIRVLIADDNRTVRRGLRLQLEQAAGVKVVAEAATGDDAVTLARTERADVVLMDLQMPSMNGLEATRRLRSGADEGPAVIVMTSFAVDQLVLEALDSGAVGYLLKSHDSDQLLPAVHAAARGEALVSSRVTASVLKELVRRRPVPADADALRSLSPAEKRVVSALALGITGSDSIAETLHVSVHTVRSQLQSAMRKTGSEDRTQLALWGVRNRLDAPPTSSV
jgi:DNA-binding NarL/FixJ family response regulator